MSVVSSYRIPFNKPALIGKELYYIRQAHKFRQLAGDGQFTKKSQDKINTLLEAKQSLLTHSATAAIEMMAILANIQKGDEIILPSYTFVSTANAFVLRGGIPVFVDIHPDTLNIDETLIEKAITKKTKAIVPVHYAGVACEMDSILDIAKKHRLYVLEDAAQGFLSFYKGKALGTIGDLAAFSFHETKNVISGEGGALIINNQSLFERAQIIREKGTDRSKFFMGLVDKYTWVDIGSSYLPGEIIASFLLAQLEKADKINKKRMKIWKKYHSELKRLEDRECIQRPVVPKNIIHNAHIYYMLTRSKKERDGLIEYLKTKGILAVTHYIPLHSSPAGVKYGRFTGSMKATDLVGDTLLRLPLYYDLTPEEQGEVIQAVYEFFS